MKILVTGANGQLGRSLQKVSAEYPGHVFTFTDLPEADITDRTAVAALVGSIRPDAIVNCAAYTAVDQAESDPETAEKINVQGPKILAGAAAGCGVKLIHISTDYVFDGTARQPLHEEDPTGPQGVYGATKLAGERAIQASGCDAAVIRTAWLYSEFGHNFVKTMLRLADTQTAVRVVSDQQGSPTYAVDLARAIVRVLEHGVEGFDLYHYAGSGTVSWFRFAQAVFELAGRSVAVEPIATRDYPTPARRPAYSVLSTEKIRSIGAVAPDWRDSLLVCLRAMKQA